MKRFYTVKEAANILGFSTNTVYKYLDGGKLRSKRIGKGRFKIPYSELEPFLPAIEKVGRTIEKVAHGNKISEAIKGNILNFGSISSGFRDYVLFKIYMAITFIGTGIIYLISPNFFVNFFPFATTLFGIVNVITGLFILYSSFFVKAKKKVFIQNYYLAVGLPTILFGLIMGATSQFFVSIAVYSGLFIFALLCLARGVKACSLESDLIKEFSIFNLVLYSTSLVASLSFHDQLILAKFFPIIFSSQAATILFWTVVLIAPSIILLAEAKRNKTLESIVFSIYSVVGLAMAVAYLMISRWDVAFMLFLYAIFNSFIIWWIRFEEKISTTRFKTIVFSFGWVSAVILICLFAVKLSQRSIVDSSVRYMRDSLSKIRTDINRTFTNDQAVVLSAIEDKGLKGTLPSSPAEAYTILSKDLFNKMIDAQRVVIINIDGIVIGSYPRNSLILGTNLSSREFIQDTKTTRRSQISGVFESIVGYKTVVITQPIFDGNKMTGIVDISLKLDELSARYQSPNGSGNVYAVDKNGLFVINPDSTKIGTEVPKEILEESSKNSFYSDGKVLRVFGNSTVPGWTVYVEKATSDVLDNFSGVHIVVSIIILVNAAITLSAAFAVAKKKV